MRITNRRLFIGFAALAAFAAIAAAVSAWVEAGTNPVLLVLSAVAFFSLFGMFIVYARLEIAMARRQGAILDGLRDQSRSILHRVDTVETQTREIVEAQTREIVDTVEAQTREIVEAQTRDMAARLDRLNDRRRRDVENNQRLIKQQTADLDGFTRRTETRLVRLVDDNKRFAGSLQKARESLGATRHDVRESATNMHRRLTAVEKGVTAIETHAVNAATVASRQVEALIFLYATLEPVAPLGQFHGWTASPDFGAHVVRAVLNQRPQLVVEAGSGLSSVLIGLALRRTGRGRLVALEHEPRFAEETRHQIAEHQLEDIVTVLDAPLVDSAIDELPWRWYQTDALPADRGIDLLVVDGPPSTIGPLARYPALPLLVHRLSPSAVILLDDADRRDEREIVERWERENPDFTATFLPHEKGTAELLRRSV